MNRDIENFIQKIICEAGRVILSYKESAEIATKGNLNNVVTNADTAAEEFITNAILEQFPAHTILGEEANQEVNFTEEHLWIIDPLDGTNNFASGMPHFSVSIAYAQKGELIAGAVYDPSRDELFSATKGMGATLNGEEISVSDRRLLGEAMICTGFYYDRGALMKKTLNSIEKLFTTGIRGLRRTGSAALDLAWSASGRFDGFFEYQLSSWDFAAGALILTESGGKITDIDGSDFSLQAKGVICANPHIFEQLSTILIWKQS